ncbi:glutaminyl-peptide cyclotransferase [Corynebacterium pseudotuberculosis]|uniref:glutaminyl-peptide cyclotransferase n=1 Tax=Corynebacterium pseudotuberculosis TaxID=1719 RepID=UPI0001DD43D1|nr:glutaminyl-peptide cyclotransferase [Corynebacterium pseudotuberculosis]ADK28392.1 glutamine cyclotransferase [Corynebacterium pseudotuberculosis FRC41]ADL20490.1 glutaminyl-peptide cyclotransferase [Corynebacterium pseudotuberculosis 1002]ADO25876.1 glutamine cyclotransferase [Corynebacterium pseudotuberculosis I19]AEX39076.1 Glutamine cyclotransferase [Corynebacterium pseudotuberculosis 3/99-5]AFF21752.1 Glutamine cyclotransferase [Corynebacterium pseudotuberculosis P54B96]
MRLHRFARAMSSFSPLLAQIRRPHTLHKNRISIKVFSVGFLSITFGITACASPPKPSQQSEELLERPVELQAEIISRHDFDAQSFTQGLEVDGEGLVVGTGGYGTSSIYRTSVDNIQATRTQLPESFFGEGITVTKGSSRKIWQLTWKNNVAIQRDPDSLEEITRVTYQGEGWGLCAFSDRLIMSDGTSDLRVLNPVTFQEIKRIPVRMINAQGRPMPVEGINELECVPSGPGAQTDTVYANRFLSTDILGIDAASGSVKKLIDASRIPNNAQPDIDNVLNGIAHIPGTDNFYITGKRWPDLYRVRFVHHVSP